MRVNQVVRCRCYWRPKEKVKQYTHGVPLLASTSQAEGPLTHIAWAETQTVSKLVSAKVHRVVLVVSMDGRARLSHDSDQRDASVLYVNLSVVYMTRRREHVS